MVVLIGIVCIVGIWGTIELNKQIQKIKDYE